MRCSRGVTASRSAPPTPRGINLRRTRRTSKSNKPRQFEESNPAGARASAGLIFHLGAFMTSWPFCSYEGSGGALAGSEKDHADGPCGCHQGFRPDAFRSALSWGDFLCRPATARLTMRPLYIQRKPKAICISEQLLDAHLRDFATQQVAYHWLMFIEDLHELRLTVLLPLHLIENGNQNPRLELQRKGSLGRKSQITEHIAFGRVGRFILRTHLRSLAWLGRLIKDLLYGVQTIAEDETIRRPDCAGQTNNWRDARTAGA